MTNEEFERGMEFFQKQQESFNDNLQYVSEKLKDVADRQDRMQEHMDELRERQDKFQVQLEMTGQAVLGLTYIVGDTVKNVAELTEAQKRTDARANELSERLDIFVNVVERYISRDRNGKNGESSSGSHSQN